MDLIQTVADKAGISHEQAEAAIDAVLGSVKEKLPAGIADQVETMIKGGEFDASALLGSLTGGAGGGIGGMLGGLFGK
jgi:hypothetical protein